MKQFVITRHVQETFTVEAEDSKTASDKCKAGEAKSTQYVENFTVRENKGPAAVEKAQPS